MVNPFPPVAGSDVKLSCNITKVGFPTEIYKYQWQQGRLVLQDNYKYHGSDTPLLTVKVRVVRVIENRCLSNLLNCRYSETCL